MIKSFHFFIAVHVLSDMIFAATTTQFIKIEPYFNKPQTFQLPVINIKIILADNLNQKIYLINDNKVNFAFIFLQSVPLILS